MNKKQIRPIAICLFIHEGSILVFEGYDPYSNANYYRPLGGGIEYGEQASQALIREISEEINEMIEHIEKLTVIENIFTYNGELSHEIVYVFDAMFVDKTVYSRTCFNGVEDNGIAYKALWVKIEDCLSRKIRLVPEQLLPLLQKIQSEQGVKIE